MSRLRNRNIRTKMHAVAKWGAAAASTSQMNGKLFENSETTADSGIAEITPMPKLNTLLSRQRARSTRNWIINADQDIQEQVVHESSEEESRNSSSSVDTMKVFNEIRNLEDSVKSTSAESYNSWNEEYENESTKLVRAEFERMERVLQCKEPIPSNYDKDEYKLWIKTFPLLSLVTRNSSLDLRKSPNFISIDQTSTPNFCDTTPGTPTTKTTHSPSQQSDLILDHLESLEAANPRQTLKSFPTHSTTIYTNKYLAVNNTINPRTINITNNHSFLQLAPLHITGTNKRQSYKPASNGQPHLRLLQHREKSTSSTSTRSSVHTSGRTVEWLKQVHNPQLLESKSYNTYNQHYLHSDRCEAVNVNINIKQPRRKSSKTEPLKSTSEFIVLPPIEGKELRSSSAATISHLGKVNIPLGRLKHPPVHPLYENDKESDHNDGFVSYRHRKRKFK